MPPGTEIVRVFARFATGVPAAYRTVAIWSALRQIRRISYHPRRTYTLRKPAVCTTLAAPRAARRLA